LSIEEAETMKQYFAKMKEPGKVLRQSQIDGMTVTVTAALAEIDKNRLVFEITAFDEQGQMARGKHERIIVDAAAFMQKAHRRCDPVKNILK